MDFFFALCSGFAVLKALDNDEETAVDKLKLPQAVECKE